MEMDNSLREAMQQMVNLQAQSLNVLQQMNQNAVTNANAAQYQIPTTQAMTGYQNYAASYAPQYVSPYGPQPAAQPTYAGEMGNAMVDSVKTMIFTDSKNKLNQTQRSLQSADLGARISNGLVAGIGGAVGTAGNVLPWFMGAGLLAPMAIGTGAAVGAGAVTSVMLDQMQQAQSYNKYLIQNSYKMINPLHSTNDKGVTGFGVSDRWAAASFLRHANTDLHVTDDDISGLLKNFTEAGLMTGTSDLENFKKKFTQLTKYVKEASLTLSATYEETAQLMGELEKAGILSQNFDLASASAKVSGSFAGIDAVSMLVNSTSYAQNTTQGTSMDTGKIAESTRFFTSTLAESLSKAKTEGNTDLINAISNLGGAEGAGQSAMNTLLRLYNNDGYMSAIGVLGFDTEGNYNESNMLNALKRINSASDLEREYDNILNAASNNEELNVKLSSYNRNKLDYIGRLNIEEIAGESLNTWKSIMDTTEGGKYSGMSLAEMISATGMGSYTEGQILSEVADGDYKTYKQLVAMEVEANEYFSTQTGLVQSIKDFVEGIKDNIGNVGQDVAEKGDNLGRWLTGTLGMNDKMKEVWNGLSFNGTSLNYDSLVDNTSIESAEGQLKKLGLWNSVATNSTGRKTIRSLTGADTGTSIKALESALSKTNNMTEQRALQDAIDTITKKQGDFEAFQKSGTLLMEIADASDELDKEWNSVFKQSANGLSVEEIDKYIYKGTKAQEEAIAQKISTKQGREDLLENIKAKGILGDSEIQYFQQLMNNSNSNAAEIAQKLISAMNGDTDYMSDICTNVAYLADKAREKEANKWSQEFYSNDGKTKGIGVRAGL